MIAQFRVANDLSGRESQIDPDLAKRINKETNSRYINREQTIYVPCYSLNTVMRALGVSRVDYFSLDIEGGEYDVVKSIDFKRLDIKSFSIEAAHNRQYLEPMKNHLLENKYTLFKQTVDMFFIKNKTI